MPSTEQSRRDVFRTIAQLQHVEWPVYGSTPLYDRSSVSTLQSDTRTVARVRFEHDIHDSIGEFVSQYPLEYVDFGSHDEYSGSTRYQMPQLLRLFLLKEIHGRDHETALLTFLRQRPEPRCELGFERMPDQSTLWRSWHQRFTTELRGAVETAARTILIKAQDAGLIVPREPERALSYRTDDEGDSAPDNQTVQKRARKITNHVSRIVFPAFSLNRGEGCEIHENAGGCRPTSDFERTSL
jgi:hypothetical protein